MLERNILFLAEAGDWAECYEPGADGGFKLTDWALADDEAFEVIMQLKSLAEVTLKIISYERIS